MIRKRGDVWYVILSLHDENGKAIKKWISCPEAKSERAAKKEEARLKTELAANTFVAPSKQTVGDYLQQWLAGSKSRLRLSAYEVYTAFLSAYLIPELGAIPLTKLGPDHIRVAYARLLERPHRRGEGTLSKRTVLACHRLLRAALAQAVRDRRLTWNPADSVLPPKPEDKEKDIWGIEAIVGLLTQAEGTVYYIPILLGMATGLRRGEILGLRWQDISFENGTLRVAQAASRTATEGIQFGNPKTSKSRRVIKLPSLAVEVLRAHHVRQARQYQECRGELYLNGGLVNARNNGAPIDPNGFSHGFAALLKKSGLPHIHFHDLRHSHVSELIRQGAPMKAISDRVGHSSIRITMDTYGHLLPGVEGKMVETLDEVIRHAMGE